MCDNTDGEIDIVYFIDELNKNKFFAGLFKITSVHRDDVRAAGFKKKKITDDQMQEIADKMRGAYLNNGYWTDLEIIAEAVLNN